MTKVDLPFADPAHIAATNDRILDAAELLFAEHGVAGTSVRMITEHAQVNVAGVNYHFGTKENLVRAVIARRLSGLEAARAAALDAVEAHAAAEQRAPTVVELVESLIGPVFAQVLSDDAGWPHFIRFLSRLAWEPGAENLAPPESSMRLFERFDTALQQASPELSADPGKRLWRLAFMRGALQHALLMITAQRTGRIPKDMPFAAEAASIDVETIKRQLIAFIAAGLSAP
ncbi:MAG: TetR family transcriptional regulator [Alphaproteobacteria bacterium]|nr:TetR family transcriptional regulator [Alphaproteobacteria bacterium]